MRRTRLLALGLATATLCALATASVSASPQPTPPAGSFRIDTTFSFETDPAIAYITTAWQL